MRAILICALAGLVITAAPADATIFAATFSGHVTTGTIDQGSFGLSAGTNISGVGYEATITYDDSLGSITASGSDPSSLESYTEIYGGYQLAPLGNFPSPVLNSSFTLNGQTASFDGLYLGDISKYYSASQPKSSYAIRTETLADESVGQIDYQLAQGVTVDSSSFSSDNFRNVGTYYNSDPSETGYILANLLLYPNGDPVTGNSELYDLGVHADSLTIRQVSSAVPEPASWAFLIVGVGFAGGTLRRSRRAAYVISSAAPQTA